ncbi:uncharacterized protein LOC142571267 [Dermacentor variabilis]|uniref:uncharacterized protein LOC142571267 n=1 Tax=Dermacentor variabilis TaxID=34621 RepID=UPI003F5B970A
MRNAIIAALLLTASLLQCDGQREADADIDYYGDSLDTTDTGMAAVAAGIVNFVRGSLGSGAAARSPAPPVRNSLSLSKQVGLMGVTAMITRISNDARQRALEQTRRVYCHRMEVCQLGRQMALRMGRRQAEHSLDKSMAHLDSAMMGIRGHDCHNMYRGCMDFQ